jgi:hypothetical protein
MAQKHTVNANGIYVDRTSLRQYPKYSVKITSHTQSLWLFGLFALVSCSKDVLAQTKTPGNTVDVFEQLTLGKSDILWVIDDSGSMAREQTQLASSFPQFFQHLVDQNVDYRIAVTTSDVYNNGGNLVSARGYPAVIVGNSQDPNISNTPDPQTAFAANIHVGTSGSARDEAMEAATLGLHQLQISAETALDAGQSVLFLRPDSALFMIFVGDGVDFSPNGLCPEGVAPPGGPPATAGTCDASWYWRNFQQAKGIGNSQLVSVSAIAGDVPYGCVPQGCGGSSGGDGGIAAAPGFNYRDLVARSGGIFGSICSCNFDSELDQLGLQALGLREKFLLTHVPADPTQLLVEVFYPCSTPDFQNTLSFCSSISDACNGSTGSDLNLDCIVPTDPMNGWVYEPSDNAILFSGSSLPTAGTEIHVTYLIQGYGS